MALHSGSFTSSFSRSLSCRRSSGRVFPTRARRRWGRFQRPRPPTLRFDNGLPRNQVDTDPLLRCPCFSTRRLTSRPFPESRRCRRMRRRRGSSATPTTLLGAAEVSPHPGVTAKISSLKLHLHLRRGWSRFLGLLLVLPAGGLPTPPPHRVHSFPSPAPKAPTCVKVGGGALVSQKSILSSVVG